MRALVPTLLLVSVAAACSSAPVSGSAPAGPGAVAAGEPSDALRYFPLEEGKIYDYVTRENGETGMLVARVHRTDATHGELRLSNATKRFALLPDGVAYVGGAYLLKTPLERGASWPGEHGGTTRVTSTDASVTVRAGSYAGCLETTEDGGRIPDARWVTTYCPGVGMVRLSVQAPAGEAGAELKSYGAPVKIEGEPLKIDR